MNVMSLVLLGIVALCALSGLRRGMLRKLSGVLSIVISTMLVAAILPTVTGAIKTQTPVYNILVAQCEAVMTNTIADSVTKQLAGVQDGLDREQIRSVMEQYGLDSSQLDYMSDEQIRTLMDQYAPGYLDSLKSQADSALDGLSRIEQTRLIKTLPLPEFMQNLLLSYNNSAGYKTLGATGFADYLIRFIADVILNVVSFLVTLMIAHVIVRGILGALDIFAHFPVLYSVNHIGGLIVGLVQGVILVWIIMLIMSMFSGTQVGMDLMQQVDTSVLLKPIYQSNIFMKIVTQSIEHIL